MNRVKTSWVSFLRDSTSVLGSQTLPPGVWNFGTPISVMWSLATLAAEGVCRWCVRTWARGGAALEEGNGTRWDPPADMESEGGVTIWLARAVASDESPVLVGVDRVVLDAEAEADVRPFLPVPTDAELAGRSTVLTAGEGPPPGTAWTLASAN